MFYLPEIDADNSPSSGNVESCSTKSESTYNSDFDASLAAYNNLISGVPTKSSVAVKHENKLRNSGFSDASDDEDFVFFKTLLSDAQRVNDPKKLDMRMDLTLFIQKFAFKDYKPRIILLDNVNMKENSKYDSELRNLSDKKDATFFDSLMPYVALVKGENKSEMRSQMILLVKKYAFKRVDKDSSENVRDGI